MHLAIDRLWSEALKEILIAIGRVEGADTYFSSGCAIITQKRSTLFRSKLIECRAKACACRQLVSRVFRPIGFTCSRRTVENDLPFALKYRLNTCRYASQARQSERLQWSSRCFRHLGR